MRTRITLITLLAAATLVACDGKPPLAPDQEAALLAQYSNQTSEENVALATLRRVTARYHRLDAAIADGFVFLHGCEDRPDEGPVGTVYVHMERLLDGTIDPASPEALIYEPAATPGQAPRLVGVELAIPFALWTGSTAPRFLGEAFQPEDEFGVFGLHVWIWRDNPEGMFAESNPRVSCTAE
jgi:hypothetical protein